MVKPLITIGITCYNAAVTIGRALESAGAQDWQNREILVVDDCSSDESVKIIQDFAGKYPEIKLIRHEQNSGAATARNTLLRHAAGEFIAFFDDDDESLPPRLRVQYQRIADYERETGVKKIACYASGTRVYPNGYAADIKAIGRKAPVPHGTGMADRILFYGGPRGWTYGGTPTCSLMIRTKILKELGGFDPAMRRVEDIDLAVRLALSGGHFIGCAEKLFIQHATWAGDKSAEANLHSEQAIAEKNKDYLQSVNRYIYARDWPKLRYYHFKRQYGRFALLLAKLWLLYPLPITKHFLTTGPARFFHERRMKKKS